MGQNFMNPCGEISLKPGQVCNLSELRPVGKSIGFLPGIWTAIDDIVYALQEDELAEKVGREEAKKLIEAQKVLRRRLAIEKMFNTIAELSHALPHQSQFSPIKRTLARPEDRRTRLHLRRREPWRG